MAPTFNYGEAFSRNIGWLTEWEQAILRHKTVAIAGMGGVGGVYVQTLARLGIGGFHLSDLDEFELANFNRQAGARLSTLGRPKVDVMAEDARDINPEVRIRTFPNGVRPENIDDFLDGVDVFVDGFDFFELDVRARVFARCRELGIPAVTAAPVGMGTAYLIFTPDGMSFDDYFCLSGFPPEKQYVNFLLGVAPSGLHARYLVDPSRADLENKRAPSTIMGVMLCAGVVGAQIVKLMLGRGPVLAAPWSHHFDAYRNRLKRQYIRGGNRHPLQALKRRIGYKTFARIAAQPKPAPITTPTDDVGRILDMARWAPSGDNSQPWRFHVDGNRIRIEVLVEAGNIYEFNNGQPTLIAAGGLIETMRIAASDLGYAMAYSYAGEDAGRHFIDVELTPDAGLRPDPLAGAILSRRTVRGPYSRRALSPADKAALEGVPRPHLDLIWWESDAGRGRVSRVSAMATDLRLRLEAAYHVHLKTIDWSSRYSRTGIPAQALGLTGLTLALMRPVMKSWRRMDVFNRYLGGTIAPRIEMDLRPGRACAAHFAFIASEGVSDVSAYLTVGAAFQRFWLTAESRGISLQPNFAPLCFSRDDVDIGEDATLRRRQAALREAMEALTGVRPERVMVMGRLGFLPHGEARPRSIRKPLDQLTTR